MTYSNNDIIYWLSTQSYDIWLGRVQECTGDSIQILWADTKESTLEGPESAKYIRDRLRVYLKEEYQELYELLS